MKRWISALLALVLCCSAALCAFAAPVAYPGGVTKEMALTSERRSNAILTEGVPAMTGKSLKRTVEDALFSDETLSTLLISLYTSVGDQSAALNALGIDVSTANVSRCLAGYPSVSKAVAAASDWNAVQTDGMHWNVTSRERFAAAVSAITTPFNDALYMLLCGGTMRVSLLTLRGDNGYENGIVPMLRALGCPKIPSQAAFTSAANSDRGSMMRNIALSLLSMVDAMLPQPVDFLCDQLPVLAAFIRDGGLENAVDALLRPITLNMGAVLPMFRGSRLVSTLLFLQNPRQYTADFSDNVTVALNDMLASSDLTLAEIDLDRLKQCRGNRADAFVAILHWLVETLRLNLDRLPELLKNTVDGEMDLSPVLARLKRHSTEELMLVFMRMLTTDEGTALDAVWTAKPHERGEVTFPEHMTRKQFKRVLAGIDATLDEFAVGFGGAASLEKTIRGAVYSTDTLTSLVKALYGALSGDDLRPAAQLLSLPTSPAAFAARLPSKYGAAKRALARASSWEKVAAVSWGFSAGSRSGFASALTAALSPLRPLLEAFLANGALPVLGALRIGGTNGYNTAVIPLLEALSCPAESIKTYAEYVKGRGTDRIITDLLNPVLDLVDRLAKKPVATLTKLLPNAAFFLENGSLNQCIENLMYPVTVLLASFSLTPEALGLDLSALTEMDFGEAIMSFASSADLGLKLEAPDLALLASLGRKTEMQSKRTQNGKFVTVDYINPDRPAVLVTLLRYVISALKMPENEEAFSSFMTGGMAGGNEMFATYSADITKEFATMTVDETIEWLYHLLFRERVTRDEPEDDGYVPHVIYTPPKNYTVLKIVLGTLGVLLLAGGVILYRKRHHIYNRKLRREQARREAAQQQEV